MVKHLTLSTIDVTQSNVQSTKSTMEADVFAPTNLSSTTMLADNALPMLNLMTIKQPASVKMVSLSTLPEILVLADALTHKLGPTINVFAFLDIHYTIMSVDNAPRALSLQLIKQLAFALMLMPDICLQQTSVLIVEPILN